MVMSPAAMQMQGQAPIFNVVLAQGLGDQMYYRQPNGWITSGPIGKANSRKHSFMNQGWTPLDKYGRFDLLPWYADHPFEVLLMRDGAKEFCLDQIKALGWHLYPVTVPGCVTQIGATHQARMARPNHYDLCIDNAVPITFPQLAGMTFEPVPACEFCVRDNFASLQARTQHMRVLHKEELGEISAAREMARGMKETIGPLLTTSGLAVSTPIPARLPFACGLCSESFGKPKELTDHVKLHADDDEPAAA